MHDDIMDRSPLRRGVPTVWKKWNEDTAILSGDVMLIDAYQRIAKAPHAVLDRVMALFSRTAAQVCDGQQYDMEFESLQEVPMAEYNKMIGLKTAVLLACSAAMGALIGGASQAECDALYQYGYELGMAFQVADDYLDAFGDEKVFGKPIGGDIVNGKKSWLTVRTLEKTPDKAAFLAAFALPADTPEQKAAKIAAVKEIYLACGVDADAKAEIVRFTDRALEAVSGTVQLRSRRTRRSAASPKSWSAGRSDGRGRDGRQECGQPLPAEPAAGLGTCSRPCCGARCACRAAAPRTPWPWATASATSWTARRRRRTPPSSRRSSRGTITSSAAPPTSPASPT